MEMLFIITMLIQKMFHLHFVLFKKSEFVIMSLIVLTLVVTGHRGPCKSLKYAGNSI